MDRQSSLPTSLIPHLYAAPRDSSTRTTLSSHSEDSEQDHFPLLPLVPPPFPHRSSSYPFIAGDRQLPPVLSANPIHRPLRPSSTSPYNNQTLFYRPTTLLPPLASLSADILPRNPSWREGEAGPSSLIHPAHRDYGPRQNRRGSSQPERVIPHPNTAFGYGSAPRELLRRDADNYSSFSSSLNQSALYRSTNSPILQLPPHQYLNPNPTDIPTDIPLSFDRRDTYSYPQVGSLSISGSSPPNYFRHAISPEPEQNYGSESLSVDIGSNDGDDGHKDKKRRADSMDTDDNQKKPSRKTAVACNFCRGRKLRCNGAKPSCHNCKVRNFDCEYVSTQRRRGPGKAPKGSRSRRGGASRSEHSGSTYKNVGDRLPTMVPDYELPPDLQPFTSVISLDTFGFQPPETSPQYPPDRHEPLMRQRHLRTRTSRGRQTSSEDRSDAEDIHRNQSGS